MPRLIGVFEYLRQSLWFLPTVFAVASIVLAGVLMTLDEAMGMDQGGIPLLYGGSVEGARAVLSTISASMLTFTGLVFTVTMLVLQLASSQLSPRVLRTFLRDRGTQAVLGLFVATFLYSLVVLRYVRSSTENGGEFIPGTAIGAAFLLLLASVAAFIYYIHHVAHAIRASSVIHSIADEGRKAVHELFPEPIAEPAADVVADAERGGNGDGAGERPTDSVPPGRPSSIVEATEPGVLIAIDEGALLDGVRSGEQEPPPGRFVELVPLVGDYVPEGSLLFRLWGEWDDEERTKLRKAVQLGTERNVAQDLAFAIRQLVDIALRALSPGINDPTTATQALDRVHDLLRRIAQRRIPSPVRYDREGQARLYLGRPDWDDYVVLATEEIRLAGEGHVQVLRRLRQLLLDVHSVAPAERQAAIQRALARLERSVERGLHDEPDREMARAVSPQRQGPMAG